MFNKFSSEWFRERFKLPEITSGKTASGPRTTSCGPKPSVHQHRLFTNAFERIWYNFSGKFEWNSLRSTVQLLRPNILLLYRDRSI